MKRWQLQEAKNRLSALVREAQRAGPQVITVHGRDAAVVVSREEFERTRHPKGALKEFFRRSPLRGVRLDLGRSRETGREVAL